MEVTSFAPPPSPIGSPADISGLQVGDMMTHVNGQNIQDLSHVNLVGVIKKVL